MKKKNAHSPFSAPFLSSFQSSRANSNTRQPIAAPSLLWLFYRAIRVEQPMAKIHQRENPGGKSHYDSHPSYPRLAIG